MRILLLGDYSNVHHTLGEGLRKLGHEVVVASDGDGWKNYPRDVDMRRRSLSPIDSFTFLLRTLWQFRSFRGFDVVQIINPVFLSLCAERIPPFFNYLKRHNGKIVMGAFGMDHYYIKACLDYKTFRYSDFNMGDKERLSDENESFKRDWLYGPKGELNRRIVPQADAIVAGLYEYYVSYRGHCPEAEGKLHFVPFPIVPQPKLQHCYNAAEPLKIFIGIQRQRSAYKGTDLMLRAARRAAERFPEACRLEIAENVPFETYKKMLNEAHVQLDQLYSYTPAMNALEAMARGTIVVGGAEPEHYALMDEPLLRPMVNVEPNEDSVYEALCDLIENRAKRVPEMQAESQAFIARHHDYLKVAKRYEAIYKELGVWKEK